MKIIYNGHICTLLFVGDVHCTRVYNVAVAAALHMTVTITTILVQLTRASLSPGMVFCLQFFHCIQLSPLYSFCAEVFVQWKYSRLFTIVLFLFICHESQHNIYSDCSLMPHVFRLFFSLISTIKIFILFSLLIFQLMMQNCKCGTCTALPGDGTCSHSFIDPTGYIQSLLLYTRPSIFLITFSQISDLLDNVFDCRVYTQTAC